MPFIFSKVNIPISREQEIQLKSRFGKAIELVPGKSEEYLLLGFEENSRLYLKGRNDEPIAYVESNIFGNEKHLGYDRFTLAITKAFNEILKIAPDHIYVNYRDIPGWGVSGIYIDRSVTG